MTITTVAPPGRSPAVALVQGFLTGGVVGVSLAALVVAVVIEEAPLFCAGLALPAVYGLVRFLAARPRRIREAAVAPRTALAAIEEREPLGNPGESSDVPVRFDLTVAPDGAPAYRVEVRHEVHRSELSGFRPRDVLVVEYPPWAPWRVSVVRRPTPSWEERAEGARIDSAPGPVLLREPEEGRAPGLLSFLGLLLGAAGMVLLFRAELFAGGAADAGGLSPALPAPSVSVSASAVESASGMVLLDPGRSFLDDGELRRAVESLTGGEGKRRAVTLVVRDRTLSVVFAGTGAGTPDFDPRSLPYGRMPALVEEARTGLGATRPGAWRITVDRLGGSVTLRVSVTGAGGTALLEADGRGEVVRRVPAR
ncbi:hypothetical protein JNUCC64_02005 [Streptomyces sp. JNUCC 64]